MFTPGRYVAIDDNKEELRQLIDALHGVGAPCLGIHYDPKTGVDPEHLRGVRVLFLDLHLIGGVQGGKDAQAFDVILEFLEKGIDGEGGPYIIVLWTSHAEKRPAFEEHLIARLACEKMPLAVLSLDKKDYLGGSKADAERLRNDVSAAISADSRLHALFSWEHDVLAAAGATLAALGGLVDPAHRTPAQFGDKLDEVISVLARAAAGADHAAASVRAAVNSALAPILADRIMNRGPDPKGEAIWAAAITKVSEKTHLGEAEAARVNTMLHLAIPPAEAVKTTDWGALIILPDEEMSDETMRARFGLTRGELMFSACPAKKSAGKKKCSLALLRLGASCDHAQNKVVPIAYAAAIVVPAGVELREASSLSKALIATPLVDIPNVGVARVFVDARYQITLVRSDIEGVVATTRIREQLLMQIAAHCAEYATRPAIVSIEPSAPADEDQPSDCSCAVVASAPSGANEQSTDKAAKEAGSA